MLPLALVAALATGILPVPTMAETDVERLEEEIEALKEGQEKILSMLEAMEEKAGNAPAAAPARKPPIAPAEVTLDVSDRPMKGDLDAPVTVIEFSDYQCPFCARHARETLPAIVENYIETGKVRYVFMDLPLQSIHPLAFKAALAGRCAAEQGMFWEMHDRLFANQRSLEPFSDHAEAIGLNVTRFESCLEDPDQAAALREDLGLASKAGAGSTPYFLLARTDSRHPDEVKTSMRIKGALNAAVFTRELEKLLRQEPAGP